MKIRKAKLSDLPQVLNVLKASLGESKIQKSELIWYFKHINNPFGKSLVLVGLENENIVGVRAFMQWQWQLGQTNWKTYRAVDTATHLKHQGKGVFKKLTLNAVTQAQESLSGFIFNTPNDKSYPGYLKMGWKNVGKIKLCIIPSFWYTIKYFFSKKREMPKKLDYNVIDTLCKKWNTQSAKNQKIFSPKHADYLKWRYQDNPLQEYSIFSTSNWYVAVYTKKHKYFNELRVVEALGVDDKKKIREVQLIISNFARENKCWLITCANRNLFKFCVYGSFGPILTINTLTNDTKLIDKIHCLKNWQYSLGDLELF